MNFQKASARLQIGSLEFGFEGLKIDAQYNPKELQIDKAIPWSKVNQSNQNNAEGIHLEFTGAEGRSMSVELLFDGYEENKSVAPNIEILERLSTVDRLPLRNPPPPPAPQHELRPHKCVVSWGQQGMPRFECVIESLSTKYSMFSDKGVPLRATCTVKLKEANVVSLAKPGTVPQGGARPGGPPGGPNGGSGGSGPAGTGG
jgi:hypothetical protein